jgi:hypothetical protein
LEADSQCTKYSKTLGIVKSDVVYKALLLLPTSRAMQTANESKKLNN